MSLGTFTPGEVKARPGRYVRLTGTGTPASVALPSGTVAVIADATDGPLGVVTEVETAGQLESLFGTAGGTATARQAILGGARTVQFLRPGSGGTAATLILLDTTGAPVQVITLAWINAGTRGNDGLATVRVDPGDAAYKQLLVYRGTTLLETIPFAVAGTQVNNLIAAVTALSDWVTATLIAAGNGIVALVTDAALTGGVQPTVNNASYTTALALLGSEAFDVVALDSVVAAVHTALTAQLDAWADVGKRVEGVVGEPKSVAIATRMSDAAAQNSALLRYAAMGFNDGTEDIEGGAMAGRIAGEIATQARGNTFVTGRVLSGALTLLESVSSTQYDTAIASGALMLMVNASGQIAIDAGLTTRVTLDADEDAGMKKIRRVRIRLAMLDRVIAATEALTVANDEDGQAALVGAAQYELDQMVAEGSLAEADAGLDPDAPPADDNVWLLIGYRDVDAADKVYITFQLR